MAKSLISWMLVGSFLLTGVPLPAHADYAIDEAVEDFYMGEDSMSGEDMVSEESMAEEAMADNIQLGEMTAMNNAYYTQPTTTSQPTTSQTTTTSPTTTGATGEDPPPVNAANPDPIGDDIDPPDAPTPPGGVGLGSVPSIPADDDVTAPTAPTVDEPPSDPGEMPQQADGGELPTFDPATDTESPEGSGIYIRSRSWGGWNPDLLTYASYGFETITWSTTAAVTSGYYHNSNVYPTSTGANYIRTYMNWSVAGGSQYEVEIRSTIGDSRGKMTHTWDSNTGTTLVVDWSSEGTYSYGYGGASITTTYKSRDEWTETTPLGASRAQKTGTSISYSKTDNPLSRWTAGGQMVQMPGTTESHTKTVYMAGSTVDSVTTSWTKTERPLFAYTGTDGVARTEQSTHVTYSVSEAGLSPGPGTHKSLFKETITAGSSTTRTEAARARSGNTETGYRKVETTVGNTSTQLNHEYWDSNGRTVYVAWSSNNTIRDPVTFAPLGTQGGYGRAVTTYNSQGNLVESKKRDKSWTNTSTPSATSGMAPTVLFNLSDSYSSAAYDWATLDPDGRPTTTQNLSKGVFVEYRSAYPGTYTVDGNVYNTPSSQNATLENLKVEVSVFDELTNLDYHRTLTGSLFQLMNSGNPNTHNRKIGQVTITADPYEVSGDYDYVSSSGGTSQRNFPPIPTGMEGWVYGTENAHFTVSSPGATGYVAGLMWPFLESAVRQ